MQSQSDYCDKPLPFSELYAAEARHFWFRHRAAVLSTLLTQIVDPLPNGYQVLEVGCGTGFMLQMMEQVCARGVVVGSDLYAESLEFARNRVRSRLVAADVYDLPFTREFDVIGMFDVLEHLKDDQGAMRGVVSKLRPGGCLVLTVPAHQSLWSYADVAAGHYRRYTLHALSRVLGEAGLQIEYLTEFMLPIRPLMWAGRNVHALLNRFRSAPLDQRAMIQRELRVNPVTNGVLRLLLAAEAPLLRRRVKLRGGTSLLAVARVPGVPAKQAA